MLILPSLSIDRELDSPFFLPYQLRWILDDSPLCLAEKSVRIGWTFADAFKNVRKRLHHPRRDYLFSSKDQSTAIEYVTTCYQFCQLYNRTRSVLSHGIQDLKAPIYKDGRNTGFTEDFKVGYIKFDNGSRILSFSSNPHALRAYGGDVGLDEFAFHSDPETLWASASGRITWNFNLAIWSSHNGTDTLFYTFCREAAAEAGRASSLPSRFSTPNTGPDAFTSNGPNGIAEFSDLPESAVVLASPNSEVGRACEPDVPVRCAPPPSPPSEASRPNFEPGTLNLEPAKRWSHYRVNLLDAVQLGLVEKINEVRGTNLTRDQFIQNCKNRSRLPEVFEQEYMCNPCGGTQGIVPWSAMERCMIDYQIERAHLEQNQVLDLFGDYRPEHQNDREASIRSYIVQAFNQLLTTNQNDQYRLGFDVAASGRGDLSVIYTDRLQGNIFQLAALFTCRTEDWHFIKTVLFTFLRNLPYVQGCGDETGLGRQICWEASRQFCGKFRSVNFSTEKSSIGFTLMNQLFVAEKRFPNSEQHRDIASDFFALRKHNTGHKWLFTEAANPLNPASHCDIAWAGGLASKAQANYRDVGAAVVYDDPPGSTVSTYDALTQLFSQRR